MTSEEQKKVQKIRAALQKQGFNLPAADDAAFAAAYTAWHAAKSPTQREKLEEPIDWAIAELSNRLHSEMELRLTAFQAFLTPKQVKAITEMGRN